MATVGGRAFFHIGVHSEEYRMVVRILKADDVDVGAEWNLLYKIQLDGTDSAILEFLLRKAVDNPVHVAAVVHVVVDVKVAVTGFYTWSISGRALFSS